MDNPREIGWFVMENPIYKWDVKGIERYPNGLGVSE